MEAAIGLASSHEPHLPSWVRDVLLQLSGVKSSPQNPNVWEGKKGLNFLNVQGIINSYNWVLTRMILFPIAWSRIQSFFY